jgi:hypothetical protein
MIHNTSVHVKKCMWPCAFAYTFVCETQKQTDNSKERQVKFKLKMLDLDRAQKVDVSSPVMPLLY